MNEEPIIVPEKESRAKNGVSFLFDVLEMFAWSLFAVFLIFTFTVRLCRVDGSSMENTLFEGENLLVYSLGYTPQQDDIIVFHMTKPEVELEKTLVKRVIATGGQELKIDFNTAEILIDGILYEDSHAVFKGNGGEEMNGYLKNDLLYLGNPNYDPTTNTMSLTVPENHLFVMGDNRNWSLDSRSRNVSFVDERCVLGKVLLRVSPFTVLS